MTILSPGLLFFSSNLNHEQPSDSPPTPILPQPPNPFSCLAALRALDKNLTQPSFFGDPTPSSTLSAGLSRLVVRHHPEEDPHEPREELVWKASQLIWSKGTIIYRKFDFADSAIPPTGSSNQNHIIQALFAYFDHPSSPPPPPQHASNNDASSLPQCSTAQGFEAWSDNRTSKPSTRSTLSPIRALCVLLLDVLKIYFPTGEEYTIAVPFPIARLWPLERGILATKKPIAVQPTPFIPRQPPSPPSLRRRGTTKRTWAAPPDPLVDSMITENETRWWSSLAGFELPDEQDCSVSEADHEEAQLRRYWAERHEVESSMLWTLSDPCTYFFQPVLTTEKIVLKPAMHQLTDSSRLSFSKATAPLVPLVTPPRKPGCSLSSGTVVFVADPKLEPHHPVCVTASTEGFTIFLCGRLPTNTSDAIIQPIPSSFKSAPPPVLVEMPPPPPPPPRSPTPPAVETTTLPRLRRSPRKLVSTRRNLTGIERDDGQPPDARPPSPSHTRPSTRLASLGHTALRRSISNAHPRHPSGTAVPLPAGPKKRPGTSGGAGVSGRRISNASNSSFTFGGASSTSGLRRTSGRKSFVEQQLELMSGGTTVGPTPMAIDRAAGAGPTSGFEEWFAGVAEAGQAERVDGQLADETLDPEWVIERLQTIEIPGRLTPEELPGIHATIYDLRGSTAYLSICIPSKALVYTFRMTRVTDSIQLESIGAPETGTAIGPVLSSRPKVYDLFKVNGKGMIEIISGDSICIQEFPHPPNAGLVYPADGSMIEFQLAGRMPSSTEDVRAWPLDNLALKVLEALAEAVGTPVFASWLSRFIALQRSAKPMEALSRMLLEVFTGEAQGAKSKPDQPLPRSGRRGLVHALPYLRVDPALRGLSSWRTPTSPNPQTPPASHKPIRPSSPKKKGGKLPLRSTHPDAHSIKTQAMIGLGKVCAELNCSISRSTQLAQLIRLILKLSIHLGWIDWTERLRRMTGGHEQIEPQKPTNGPPEPLMPDLVDHLERMRVGVRSPFEAIFDINPDPPSLFFYGTHQTCPRSQQISSLYRLLFSTEVYAAKEVLLQMDRFGWTRDDLDDIPWTIALPLREALRDCQFGAPTGLPESAYELIDRPDLAIVARDCRSEAEGGKQRKRRNGNKSFHINTEPSPTLRQLCAASSMVEHPTIPISESKTISLMDNPSHMNAASRFSDDMRIIEAARMLNYTNEVVMIVQDTLAELAPPELARQFSNIFSAVSKRTMSLPFGGACFWYRTDPNIAAAVPLIKLDVKVMPMGVVIQPDPAKLEPLAWPRFHAGVAAALSLSVIPGAFDSSQISLDRPEEPDERHAGYLLGLGLNGHLRSISRLQIYRYLEAKHEMTSTGLLLGLAATFLGTGDPRASSIIAAHVPALHPTQSIELQVSPLTQSAGFISFGLLHLGTGNRRLSDGMLRELARTRRVLTDTPEACRETYTLCAGLSYGLVMLGRGTESSTPAHKDLMRTFKSLIHGDGAHPLPGLNPPTSTIDVSVTSPAATLAIALLYLKTGREEAVAMCEIPQTETRLEYIRPDLLLLRTLAKCLIRWDSIEPKMSWVEGLLPKVVMEAVRRAERSLVRIKSEVEMVYWSVVTGAAMGLALKHAGTASAEVHTILLKLYDRLLKAANSPALSVQGKLRRHCLRSCHNVITLGLGIVMAGTGELEVLRRLRIAHANITEVTNFGTHLATHFALGLLFLGGGRFTLSTTNAAIACLVCSIYPIFPSASDDQVHHLQPLRHLWVLAVEPRCVVARDVDRKGELIFLPLKLKLHEPANAQQRPVELSAKLLTAPTLVPELGTIRSVTVESPRYWPLVLDLEHNPAHRAYFVASQTLWVKRKVGHLSYSQDPKGTKSIASRGRGAEEVAACAIDDLGRRSRLVRAAMKAPGPKTERGEISGDLNSLIRGFDLDEQAVGLVDYICARPGITGSGTEVDFSAFVASALLQCLVHDKLELVPVYLDLFCACLGRRGGRELVGLVRFYRENLGGPRRTPGDEEREEETRRLMDADVLEQIERQRGRGLKCWEESDAGMTILEAYLDSDGLRWPRQGTEDGEWVAEWVGVHAVPFPGTLKRLRRMVEEQLRNGVSDVEAVVRGWLGRSALEDRFVDLFVGSVRKGIMGSK
ncbi:hypothetical protein CROQUDRAFT_101374 [Cronartium quercuum f. sp. fusiforme G11]|uniref:Anaphase-promoting complex subunit 1 n=1 Tax=Cronartium quercuum f. sp. fusiforme G11 TaxID=708437 RepID=A0A9P6T5D1_9BASI|nr:hypothetical protein CROQUDRAFT_101374 [Cronartium quercuum f. sp. fusiforme G11]